MTTKPHGTLARYTSGCHCQTCRDAAARYERGRTWDLLQGRSRTVPAIGAQRRLQALVALGWTQCELTARLGLPATAAANVGRLIHAHRYVMRSTHERIDALYRELSMTLGPSDRARLIARKNGWVPPLCWDDDIDDPKATPHGLHDPKKARGVDEIAVERRMAGDHVSLTTDEAREVVERLRRCGVDDAAIERRTRLNPSRYCGSRERRAS